MKMRRRRKSRPVLPFKKQIHMRLLVLPRVQPERPFTLPPRPRHLLRPIQPLRRRRIKHPRLQPVARRRARQIPLLLPRRAEPPPAQRLHLHLPRQQQLPLRKPERLRRTDTLPSLETPAIHRPEQHVPPPSHSLPRQPPNIRRHLLPVMRIHLLRHPERPRPTPLLLRPRLWLLPRNPHPSHIRHPVHRIKHQLPQPPAIIDIADYFNNPYPLSLIVNR